MVRLLGPVACFVASALLVPVAASADQVGTVQAQISSVRAAIAASAARVHQLTAAFDQANLTAGDLAQQLAADQANLAATRRALAASEAILRDSALRSYTGGGGSVLATSGTALDPAVSSAYIDVAVGNLSDSVDQFDLRQHQLSDAEAAVAAQQRAALAAVAAASTARQAAIQEAVAAQGRLGDLQAQLDQLATAAAAAAAAAHIAAPAAPAQGSPVGNGLVAVVTNIVKAPAPTTTQAPPAAATPSPTTQPPTTQPPTTQPPTTQPPTTQPPVQTGGHAGGPWLQLRECESGDNYRANTGNGFYGAYQFSASTWTDLGYPGRPDLEPPAMQDAAAMKLQAEAGWGQWPACSAALGL